MTWVCPTCETVWSEKPTDEGIVGCPECGDYPDPDSPEPEDDGTRELRESDYRSA